MNWTGDGRSLIIGPSVIQERIYEAIPNAKGRVWGTDVAINSAGFRDRDYSVKKPAGVYRIAVIGDSIAFGNNLPVDDTFSNQLEQLFAGEATRLAYGSDQAEEGRDAFLAKRKPDFGKFPWHF